MAKRFTDTDKYKKGFIRSLPGPYKLLWDYLYSDCNHAGIWHVDFQVAQIYIGQDMPVEREIALEFFNAGKARIIEFDGGKKWFLPGFIKFQYENKNGDISLNRNNTLHRSILNILEANNLLEYINYAEAPSKPLESPCQGVKDKDRDKDKEKGKGGEGEKPEEESKPESSESFMKFYSAYPKQLGRTEAFRRWKQVAKSKKIIDKIMSSLEAHKKTQQWQENKGQYVPKAAKWLHERRFEDDIGQTTQQYFPQVHYLDLAEHNRRIREEYEKDKEGIGV